MRASLIAGLLGTSACLRLPSFHSRRCTAPHCCAEVDAASAVAKWLDLCGAERNGIEIGETDGMRGLVSTKTLTRGLLSTDMLKIPVAVALSDSDEEFRETAFGAAVPAVEWLRLQPDARLALRLLDERRRGEASPWHRYLQLLPEHVPTGRHLPSTAIDLVDDTSLREQLQLSAEYARKLHGGLLALAAKFGDEAYTNSEEELGWALDMVHSRSFTVDAGSRGLRRYMVPHRSRFRTPRRKPMLSKPSEHAPAGSADAHRLTAPTESRNG